MKKATHLKIVAFVLVIFTLLSICTIGVAADVSETTAISIPDGKQAVYTAKITRGKIDRAIFTLGSFEIFSITSGAMKLCNSHVQGKYADGNYTLKAYINPTQQMLVVEVTLPDGGIVYRGTSAFTEYTSITETESKEGVITESSVTYSDIEVADYKLTDTEPENNAYIKNDQGCGFRRRS